MDITKKNISIQLLQDIASDLKDRSISLSIDEFLEMLVLIMTYRRFAEDDGYAAGYQSGYQAAVDKQG